MTSERIRSERLAKLAALRAAGVEPYWNDCPPTGDIESVRALCPPLPEAGAPAPEAGPVVTVAGRVVAIRDMGKSRWLDLRDRSGKIQVNLLHKRLGENGFAAAGALDIGDIVGATGDLLRSRVGEITVFATELRFLSKALEPLPAKWSGLRDVEIRYRRRYLDLIANEESRERFILRSRLVSFIRRWLDARGFLEVETPMLQPIYGGAAARPFVTRHHSLGLDLYLRISPETYLKRLLVGGLDRVYEINRNFRNEGIDTTHNPEFTMMEVYQAYTDYLGMMDLLESLVDDAARELLGRTTVNFDGKAIALAKPWPRRSMRDLVREMAGVDPDDPDALADCCRRLGVPPEKLAGLDHDRLLMAVMDGAVEPRLEQPTFVTHHPASLNPLCRRNRADPRFADRFEAMAAGFELANAFSELNDPLEQRERFQAQVDRGGEESHGNVVDEDYVSALEVGLPPAGGIGVGIDRLVMLLTDSASIRDVILFPTLRPE